MQTYRNIKAGNTRSMKYVSIPPDKESLQEEQALNLDDRKKSRNTTKREGFKKLEVKCRKCHTPEMVAPLYYSETFICNKCMKERDN